MERMTNKELVTFTSELAGEFYSILGYKTDRPGEFKWWESSHPMEVRVFDMAAIAMERIRGSDVYDAIDDMED